MDKRFLEMLSAFQNKIRNIKSDFSENNNKLKLSRIDKIEKNMIRTNQELDCIIKELKSVNRLLTKIR
jgi:hypothetical protein